MNETRSEAPSGARRTEGSLPIRALSAVLNIPEASVPRALRMLGMIFTMSSALVLMKAAQSGLFLAVFTRDEIPWAFAASAITLASASAYSVAATPRLGATRMALRTLAMVSLALSTLFASLHLHDARWLRFITYVVVEASAGLLVIQIWSVASAATDARTVRQLMPIAGIGAGLAWVIFGLFVRPLGHALGAESLLLVAPAMLALCAALVRAIALLDVKPHVPGASARGTRVARLKAGFGFVIADPLMRLLTALSLLSLLLEQLMDLHLMSEARATYDDAEAISAFFGSYYAATSALSLILLAGFAGRAMAALGATRSLSFFPLTIAILAMVAVAIPGLATAVALRGAARVLKQSLWSSSMEQLQTPLSGVRRAQARSAIRGVLSPGGYAISALALAALPPDTDPRVGAALASLVALGMLVLIIRRAKRTYGAALHRAVDERRWDLSAGATRAGLGATELDVDTQALFLQEVMANDPAVASLAAEVAAAVPGRRAAEVLARGLDHEAPDVRLVAARGLQRRRSVDDLGDAGAHALVERAVSDPDARVREAAVRASAELLGVLETSEPGVDTGDAGELHRTLLAGLEDARGDRDPRVVAIAHVGAIRATCHGEERGIALAPCLRGEAPAGLGGSRDVDEGDVPGDAGDTSEDLAAALLGEALAALDEGAMDAAGVRSQLGWILERGDAEARVATALAVIRTNTVSLLPDVVRLLKDPLTAPATARALVELPFAIDPTGSGPETLAASVSRLASRMARDTSAPPAAALVLRLLEHRDVDIRRAATLALSSSIAEGRRPPLALSAVLPLVERDARRAYLHYSILAGIAHDDGVADWDVEEAFVPLARELELEAEAARQDVLAALSLAGQRRLVGAAEVARRRPSDARDAQLAELLDVHLPDAVARWVVPLFERLPLRERVEVARELGASDERAASDPLYGIVALGDRRLLGMARLCYGARYDERAAELEPPPLDDAMIPTLEKMRFLRSVPLFASIAGDDLQRLAELVESVEHAAGERIFAEGDPGDALYVIIEGDVALRQSGVELARVGPREFFGELALLDSQPRNADADCVETTRLIRLRGADLDELLTRRPAASREILRVVVKRLRETVRRVTTGA